MRWYLAKSWGFWTISQKVKNRKKDQYAAAFMKLEGFGCGAEEGVWIDLKSWDWESAITKADCDDILLRVRVLRDFWEVREKFEKFDIDSK